jgi:hypothetical protein
MSDRPKRIQRKRSKGWRMPENAVYVGRPGAWGNPFHIEQLSDAPRWWRVWPAPDGTDDLFATKLEAAKVAVTAYDAWISGGVGANYFSIDAATYHRGWVKTHAREQLGGKDLACWCPLDQPCHADVLLRLANPEHNPNQQEASP